MQQLLRVEERLQLFDRQVDGVYFWEYARLQVYYCLMRELGLLEFPPPAPLRVGDVIQAATRGLVSATWRNPHWARPPCDVLFLGYPRRKQLPDGRWSDIHFDPILRQLKRRYVYLEPMHLRRHAMPSATPQAYHHDWFDWQMLLRRGPLRWRPSSRDARQLAEIDAALREALGVSVSASAVVAAHVGLRHALVPAYRRLLAKLRPKLVVVISPNYREIALVEAARSLGMHTAELQHGAFGIHDPSYTFSPRAGSVRFFADDLLVYGDFWSELIRETGCPARVINVGFAHFDSVVGTQPSPPRKNQIVFLSQATIGHALSQIAVDLAHRPDFSAQIVYRLHPDERDWPARYPHLAAANRITVDAGGEPLYAVLQRSRAQAGVGSFALYEGLALGLATYVADLPGNEYLQPVVDGGTARLINSAADIPTELPLPAVARSARFFRPGAVDNVLAYIEMILGERSGAPSKDFGD